MRKIILITLVSIISACSNDNDVIKEPLKTYLKSEIMDVFNGTTNYTLSSNYSYDSKNRISGIEEISSNIQISSNRLYSNFVYKSNGNLESYQLQYTSNGTTYNYKFTYIYAADGKLQEVTTTNLTTNTIVQRNTFEYTSNELIYRYVSSSGAVSQTNVYTHNGDNVSKIEYKNQAGNTIQVRNFYNYDDKPNPLQIKWASVPDRLISKNNCSSESRTLVSTNDVTTVQYNYEFNSDGYPTKRTDITNNRNTIWTYEKR